MNQIIIEDRNQVIIAVIPCTFADASAIFYKTKVSPFGCVKAVECDEMGEITNVIARKEGRKYQKEVLKVV